MRHVNHELSPMACPHALGDVDLFAPGAAEHWYEAYAILHAEAPVQRLPGEGLTPDRDAFILSKYEDIARVVRDWERYPPTLSLLLEARKADPASVRAMPDIDAMVKSIASLRPNPELIRSKCLRRALCCGVERVFDLLGVGSPRPRIEALPCEVRTRLE